jgi:putative membrane protein
MLKQVVIVWVCTAVAIAITAALVPSVEIDGGPLALIGVAAIFGLVNAIIGPLLRLLSIPLLLITFGLFALVINAALLGIVAGLSDSLEIGGFFSTVVAAFLISVFSAVLGWVTFRVFTPDEVAAT